MSKSVEIEKEIFTGRENELNLLSDLCEEVLTGNGKFVLVTGEAGIGKSALIKHFVKNRLDDTSFQYLEESFDDLNQSDPFDPFLRLLLKIGVSRIESLLKKLSTITGGTGAGHYKASHADLSFLYRLQSERGIIQQIIVNELLEAGKEQAYFIHLKNLHRASQASWQLIHYLANGISERKIVLIGSLRQDGKQTETGKIPVYADILKRMNRDRVLEKIILTPFNKRELKSYLFQFFKKTDFDSNFVPLLLEVSGGIPGRLKDLLTVLIEKGLIFNQNNIWYNKETDSETLIRVLNDEISSDDFERYYDSLAIFDKHVLNYSALFEHKIPVSLLSEVLNCNRIKLWKLLQKLADEKIFYLTDDEVKFRNSLYRHAIRKKIPEASKRGMHYEIAQAVHQVDGLPEMRKNEMLAFHFLHAGQDKLAFKYYHTAADLGLFRNDFAVVEKYYQIAIDIALKNQALLDMPETFELFLEAIWLERILGHWDKTLEYCEFVKQTRNYQERVQIRTTILLHEGFTYLKKADWEEALDRFNPILSQAESEVDEFVRALANYGSGVVLFELGRYNKARLCYQKALEISEKITADALAAHLYNSLGVLENVTGNRLKAVAYYSKSIPLFKKLGDKNGLANIYHNIGMSFVDDEKWEQANSFYGKCLAVADEMGLRPLKANAFLNRAFALVKQGKLEEAQEYNEKARRLLTILNDVLGLAEHHKIQGVIYRERKEFEKADREFQSALKIFKSRENKLGLGETHWEMVILNNLLENPSELQSNWKKVIEYFEAMGLQKRLNGLKKIVSNFDSINLSNRGV
ncbi:MAG: hypothetical protein Kow0037_11250 [Calditrichia bacterium]